MSDPIVVLGMHRSGTSFLIRALNLAGLWLGSDDDLSTIEGRGRPGNPKGNYEIREAIMVNDAILARSGGAWFSPPGAILRSGDDCLRIRRMSAALEHSRPSSYPRWGWKDPRTVLTFDAWTLALQRPIFVVASFRHPTAVARSLFARDKIPLPIGYALWEEYNARLLRIIGGNPHILLRFDVDKEQLVEQVMRVCHVTGLREERESVGSWHDPELVRSDVSGQKIPILDRLTPIWDQLIERSEPESFGRQHSG